MVACVYLSVACLVRTTTGARGVFTLAAVRIAPLDGSTVALMRTTHAITRHVLTSVIEEERTTTGVTWRVKGGTTAPLPVLSYILILYSSQWEGSGVRESVPRKTLLATPGVVLREGA